MPTMPTMSTYMGAGGRVIWRKNLDLISIELISFVICNISINFNVHIHMFRMATVPIMSTNIVARERVR